MATKPRHAPRYVLWSVPDCAPPLPVNRERTAAPAADSGITSAKQPAPDVVTEVKSAGENGTSPPLGGAPTTRPGRSFSGSSSVLLSLKDDAGSAITDSPANNGVSRSKFGDQAATGPGDASADAKAVQEAVLNPSNWLLRNRETGQEVEARTFVDVLLQHAAVRPTLQQVQPCSSSSPLLGSSGSGWTSRLHRNGGGTAVRRPTLLPPGSVSFSDVHLPSAHMVPRSPPTLQLPNTAVSKTPMRLRGRSSLPDSSIQTRSSSNSHTQSRSSLAGSGTTVDASERAGFKLSNMNTAQIVPQLHPGGIRAISFSPSGAFLATAGADHRCFVFRVQESRRSALGEGSPNAAAPTLAEGEGFSRRHNAGPTGRLFDDEPMRILSGHVGEVVCLSWAPDDTVLLTGSADGTVRNWHPLDGDKTSRVYEHGGRVTSVAWDPGSVHDDVQGGTAVGGRRFLTGCMDGRLRLFSVGSSEAESSVLAERAVTAVAFAPGGATFVAGFVGGNVGYFRTNGMVQELTAECRRHGLRRSASQHARHATSPVRRLSAGNGGGHHPRDGVSTNGSSKGHGGRRRITMGPDTGSRGSGDVEERVTGLCFRPQRRELAGLAGALGWKSDRGQLLSSSGDTLGGDISAPPSHAESAEDVVVARASAGSEEGEDLGQPAIDEDGDGHAWVGPTADLLVSTNDSRTRVLVSDGGGNVTVGVKLKGHNTDGMLGRHAMARYSDDGELVISGSTDGNVHIWSTPTPAFASGTSRRAVAWSSGREGHERAQVCEKMVPVPLALFAPTGVATSVGGASCRVVVTGDDEGYLKVFIG